jgi:hypothetical protein
MACGNAKLTGEVGACIATSGPGAIRLLNGLYDAKLDHAPVVAIVGQQKRMALGAEYQQEVDLQVLSDGAAVGGHLLRARVWPTLELVLVETDRRAPEGPRPRYAARPDRRDALTGGMRCTRSSSAMTGASRPCAPSSGRRSWPTRCVRA